MQPILLHGVQKGVFLGFLSLAVRPRRNVDELPHVLARVDAMAAPLAIQLKPNSTIGASNSAKRSPLGLLRAFMYSLRLFATCFPPPLISVRSTAVRYNGTDRGTGEA